MNDEIFQKCLTMRNEKAIKDKVNLEAEVEWAQRTIGCPMPTKEKSVYLKEIGRKYLLRNNTEYMI